MYFEDFLRSLYKYLLDIEDYNNNIIRKLSRNLDKTGEFRFSTDLCKLNAGSIIKSDCRLINWKNLEEIEKTLIRKSKEWELQISKCCLYDNRVHIFLDRETTYKKVTEQVFKQSHKYGAHKLNLQKICLLNGTEKENTSELNLSQLRLSLLEDVLSRLLNFKEWDEEGNPEISVYLSLQPNKDFKHVIFCGHVSSVKGTTNCSISATDFYSKRTVDMRLMAQHKYGLRTTSNVGWEEFFKKLGEAAVTIDLLQNKCSRNITININDAACSSSKGASFILYNCARLAQLFKEFDKRVSANIYSALPPLDNINFNLLIEPEEWELLYVYVLQFPYVINGCIRDVLEGKVNVHNLCSALSEMCAVFSVYYRRVRVLTEPRDHLFSILHARIYLLKAVEQVLHNGLFLLNIQPVKQM